MRQNDFKTWLEKSSGYESFMIKAQEFQENKNKKRKKKERWNEGKVERATNAMWQQFIVKKQVVENFTKSVSELEFE